MKKIDVGQIIGILANFGVIGGLIFVGLEIRQDREFAAIDASIAGNEDRKAWSELVSDNAEVWVKGRGAERLSEPERVQFEALAQAFISQHYFSWFRQSQLSAVPGDRFAAELAAELVEYPGLLAFWRKDISRMDQSYRRIGAEPGVRGAWRDAVNEQIGLIEKERTAVDEP